ncbi:MAG TPA: M28 family peptidase [Candidatus Fimimorpha excrementavium]|nr:M28 family peptidase [Candidatus Fimimorpha excrementavium]
MDGRRRGWLLRGRRIGLVLLAAVMLAGSAGNMRGEAEEGEGYGEEAWQYLTQMTERFPNRTAGSEAKHSAGQWIADEMAAMGYQVEAMPFEQGGFSFVNYIATKPGYGDGIVYVGAHYDSVDTTGTDDNASGVAAVMEVARQVAGDEMEQTLKFCFFDGEESTLTGIGYAGSCYYTTVKKEEASRAVCYINVDCVAAGDRLFAYGGVYGENGELLRREGYDWANQAAAQLGVSLNTLPESVEMFETPTRITGSDQHYFNAAWGIPYVYFEASRWCEADGSGGNEQTNQTCWYQTADERLSSTGGRVMHMAAFDDLAVLEEYFPGRIRAHLADTTAVITHMLRNPELRFQKWEAPEPEPGEGAAAESEPADPQTDIREETKGTAETADGEAGTSGETRDWNMFSWTLLPWKKTGMDFITFSILQNPIL